MRQNVLDFFRRILTLDIHNQSSELSQQLSTHCEDLFLLTLVDQFYSSKQHSFASFVNNYTKERLNEAAPILYQTYIKLYDEINRGVARLDLAKLETSNIALIGDLHPTKLMRYKISQEVIFQQDPYYTNLLENILPLFPDIMDCFPKHSYINGFYRRTYLPVSANVETIEDVKKYYITLGRLVAFVLFLRGIDMNVENIIIHQGKPILFDFECIFSGENETKDTYSLESTGVVRTAIEFDVSAFTGGLTPVQSYLKPVLSGSDKNPTIEWRVPSKGHYYNKPSINNESVNPLLFKKEVIFGLQTMTQQILDNIDILTNLVFETTVGVRTIISPTRFYRMIMQSYTFPQIYSQISQNDFFYKELKKRSLIYDLHLDKSLIEYEIDCLSSWLIPKYTTEIHSTEVLTADGEIVAHYKKPLVETWQQGKKHFKQLSKESEKSFLKIYS